MLAVLLFAGCNNAAISLDSGDVPTLNDYLQHAGKLGCKFYVRCGFASRSQEAECETWLGQFEGASLGLAGQAISAGRLAYDPSAAASCLNALATDTCDPAALLVAETGAGCQSILKPKVAVGGACDLDAECINGFCDQSGAASGSCLGACAAFAARGAPCDGTTTRCGSADFCDSTNMVCVALLGEGQSCDQASAACAAGLGCVPNGTTSTCQRPGGEGSPCGFFPACNDSSLFCDFSDPQGTVCRRRQPRGGACISSDGCADGLACVLDDPAIGGTCQPFLDVGQACTGITSSACAGDAACDPSSHTCKLKGQAGDDCTGGCSYQFYCNAANQCAAGIPYGQACTPPTAGDDPCLGSECDPTTNTCGFVCN